MYQQYYYVPKVTGVLSDTLLAFGVADLVDKLVDKATGSAETTLEDVGGYYRIDAGRPIQEEWAETVQFFDQIDFVASSKVAPPNDLPGLPLRNVDDEWASQRQYIAALQQTGGKRLTDNEEQQAADKPKPDWTVVTYLGDYRMQAQAIHNDLVATWRRTGELFFAENLRAVLALFAAPAVDAEAVQRRWKQVAKEHGFADSMTASQLFNPHMGKGQNRAKANGLAMGNESSFWLVEYLKAVGLWLAAAPRKAQNSDLRKTYILAPRRIRLADHRLIFDGFRERLRGDTAVKMDITSALLYVDELLRHVVEAKKLGRVQNGPISNVVGGMNSATYQLLSQNSYTMMNLAWLGLPDWMPQIRSYADATLYRTLLQEHLERIRAIDEERSDGYRLLQGYREFVGGRDVRLFLDFCAGYGSYLISELGKSRFYVKPFSEENLRSLLTMTAPELSPILENEGFRNIAAAIRRSTVSMQYLDKRVRPFPVRYGLGQELQRAARYRDTFVQALSAFVQSYNDESARVFEQTKGADRRALIRADDVEDVLRLIDGYGHATVAALLIAYGYAGKGREQQDDAAQAAVPAAAE